MMLSPSRGEHAHAVFRGARKAQLPVGYRIIGWEVSDEGRLLDTIVEADGLVSLTDLEVRVRKGGRRLETVPFGWMGCCDLYGG